MKLRGTILMFLLTASIAVGETRIRISGNKDKSEGQILGFMGGRLEHIRNDPASPSRADDAAFLVRQVMQKDGYTEVKVDWKIINRSEILLIVAEGGRRTLGEVVVEGVPGAQAEKLAKLYQLPAVKDRPLGSGAPPFREGDVEIGLSYVRQELYAEGYWGAGASITSQLTDAETGEVSVTIKVDAGEIHYIWQPKITSPDGRGVRETREAVEPFIDLPATTANLNLMRAAVEENFISQGYPDAKITVNRSLDSPHYIPEFYIDLGKRVRLRDLRVTGLEKTNPKRIERRMKDLEGEWYDEAAVNKRLRGFLATGAFSSVRVTTDEVSEYQIDATLHLEETRAREVTAAAGIDSYQGFLLRTTYADRNLMGELLGFSTGFEFSSRGVLGETRLTDPWLFGSDIAATARVYALIYGREGYQTFETGLEGKTTLKFGDHYTLDVLAGYSFVETTEDGLPLGQIGESVYTHPRLRVQQKFDHRDSSVLPTKGWHVENSVEVGAAIGDMSLGYAKTTLTGGWYHKINDNYQLGLGGELGVVIPSGDSKDFPIDMRLFNGGSRSVRSFPERELGPTVDGYPTGGEAIWNTSAELVRSIGGNFKAVAFLDAGSLALEYEDFTASEIEMAVGLGVRLDLPIGPVRLEYGYSLTRDDEEPVGALHFAIGAAF